MKDVQCHELSGGIALKNHAFSFFHFHFINANEIKQLLFRCDVIKHFSWSSPYHACNGLYVYIYIYIYIHV